MSRLFWSRNIEDDNGRAGDAQALGAQALGGGGGAGPTIAEVLTASGDRLGMVKEIMQAADLLAQDTTAGLGGSPEDVARRATLGAIAKAGTSHRTNIRVRVEIMGSPKCRNVGKCQSVLITIHPIIFTRTRMFVAGGGGAFG